MTKDQFVKSLNEDLSSEFRSIIQYVLHIATVKGATYQPTLEELEKHLAQEVQHALTVARQIVFLGGTPDNRVPDADATTEPKAALKADLDLETRQLQNYRQRVEQAHELGLPDVAESLAPLLQQTQEHVRDLQGVLDK